MSIALDSSANIPWWKEPTKDQWNAYVAAWLGWTLDAFDFTIFLLIMVLKSPGGFSAAAGGPTAD